MEAIQNFWDAPNLILETFFEAILTYFVNFWRRFSFQMALEAWKIIFNTRWRCLKHSPNFKECVSKNITVVRHAYKWKYRGNVKRALKKVSKIEFGASRKFWLSSIFGGDFLFKRLQNRGKFFLTHVEDIWNTIWTSRNVSVKKLGSYDM